MSDINIGQISEALNDKLDRDGMNAGNPASVVIESYSNGTSWYRIYSDGWIEQGGKIVINSATVSGGTYNNTTLEFIKPFSNLMSWYCQAKHDRFNAGFAFDNVGSSASNVNIYQVNDSTGNFSNPFVIWYACGYIA